MYWTHVYEYNKAFRMDGWMGRWMYGSMDGWMDRSVKGTSQGFSLCGIARNMAPHT